MSNRKVAIIGGGLVGKSWSMLFAAANIEVYIYDVDVGMLNGIHETIHKMANDLEAKGYLKGNSSVAEQISRIHTTTCLKECIEGAEYIQECVPENKDLKAKVFSQVDEFLTDDQVFASSVSTFPISQFTENLKHRQCCVVAQPVNPAYHIRLVEIVPAPWTNPAVVEKTTAILRELDMAPVLLKKEVTGFALNRIQCVLFNECLSLVQNDVLSPEDIDTVLTEGLGMRYALIGPFHAIHLNAEGVQNYAERYGKAIYGVNKEQGIAEPVAWDSPAVKTVHEAMTKKIPLDKLVEARQKRDEKLAALGKLKRNFLD